MFKVPQITFILIIGEIDPRTTISYYYLLELLAKLLASRESIAAIKFNCSKIIVQCKDRTFGSIR